MFDAILLDAPCSGTGVIRRHPDIKLLRRDSDIEALHEVFVEQSLPFTVIADSEVMRELLSLVRQVASSPWTALIHGETGL